MARRTINLIDSKGRNTNLFIDNEGGRGTGTWISRNPGMLNFIEGSFRSTVSGALVMLGEGTNGPVQVAVLNNFWTVTGLRCGDNGTAAIYYGALLENDESARWVDD